MTASDFRGDADDTITLDETERHRRRILMTTDGGKTFLLDLPKAQLLADGDVLPLSDGSHVEVKAKAERLLKVTADSSEHLLKLAWQIGNRHLAAQINSDHILIRSDHVISKMLIGLGGRVEEVEAPFNPEGGAYHAHSHHHD
ncbi:MAG: urease accessory protein UreE [Rhizobiaceae bacterium]